jgi:mannose-6-phosphate isomerase-like protein (cupin superfamily)
MQHTGTTATTARRAATAGIVPDGSGETLLSGPIGAVLLAGVDATGGAATFVIHPLAPRALGSLVHTHKHEDEWSFVLEGEVGVELGDEEFVARAGDLVMKPRGVPHAFWNAGDAPARLLEVITPGGFEGYFSRLAEILRPGVAPDMAALATLASDYDLDVDPASVARLAQAHQLRME